MSTEALMIRGSEVGFCPRYLSIKALGGELETTPGWLQKIFDSGTDQEGEAVAWLENEYGTPVTDRQREVRVDIGKVSVVGHIDAWQDGKLVEIKSLGEQKRSLLAAGGLEAMPAYLAQAVIYYAGSSVMGGMRYVIKHWEQDEYTVLEFDHAEMNEIAAGPVGDALTLKLESVRQAVEFGEPLPVPEDTTDYDCANCRARFHCYDDLLEQSIVLSGSKQDVDLMASYQFYQQISRVAENIKKRVQEHFAGRLAEEDAKKISTVMGNATLVKGSRKRLDAKKAKGFLTTEQLDACESTYKTEFVRITVRDN